MKCPCCKNKGWDVLHFKELALVTEWGYENFIECLKCGIIFRQKE